MANARTILTFDDINALHAATGYAGRTDLPAFHIYTLEDTYPQTRALMPPYTLNAYQVVLLENSRDARLNIHTQAAPNPNDMLFFASPEHVLAWMRGEAQRGFNLFFKPEFLAHYPAQVQDEFVFFRLAEINWVAVTDLDKQGLRQLFDNLLSLFQSAHPYRRQMLQSMLLALLFECRRIWEAQQNTWQSSPAQTGLAFRFQQFVGQHFLTHKTVEAYAQMLAVTPDYLGQLIKSATGRTPSALIGERIALEAKKLLSYSDLSAAEIADYLGFAEPTHFGRFFRKHAGSTPAAWRRQQRQPS